MITILYRPVGQAELDLIAATDFTEFPPRLPEQPIFYPVCSEDYAAQIARDWNAKYNSDKIGYVTKFIIKTEFLNAYEIKTVGGSIHQEYWIPATDLAEFNENIVGKIETVATFIGE